MIGALILLGLVWALDALTPDLLPNLKSKEADSYLERSLSLGLAGLLSMLAGLIRGESWHRVKKLWQLAGVGCGLFVLPELLVQWSAAGVSGYERTLLFTLVPVLVVVFEVHLGGIPSTPLRGGLGAALASIVGALFVFPVEVPATLASCLAFGMVVVAAALIAAMSCFAHGLLCDDVNLPSELDVLSNRPYLKAAVIACCGVLGLVLAQGLIYGWESTDHLPSQQFPLRLSAWKLAFETPEFVLLLWLLPRMRPSRLATRYVLAPVLTILMGVFLLKLTGAVAEGLQPRTWVGLMIMTVGAVYLLLAPEATNGKSSIIPRTL